MSGRVKAGGKVIEKPGSLVEEGANLEVATKKIYVSRGGLKLEGAFDDFNIDAREKKAVDVGSSTGGFTDFLLKNGAKKVICIDVGYGQLSWEIRKSPDVIVLERTNIRNLDTGTLPYKSDITVVDLSFISIKKVLSKILDLTGDGGNILLLVKPQFEVERNEVENMGIIKSKRLHVKVLSEITGYIKNLPVRIEGFTYSKIKGAKGNIEFWIFLIKNDKGNKYIKDYDKIIRDIVEEAHFYFSQS
jgi:23S rRNA (cytidine1920-2'-O)/16S rRNA (cytidine1409-2'-O)-methyltransferase